jgi:hypothetical protein
VQVRGRLLCIFPNIFEDDFDSDVRRCAIPIESCGAMFCTNSILSNGTTLLPHYRLTDGTVQLLDLKKKPIRAAPIRIDNE